MPEPQAKGGYLGGWKIPAILAIVEGLTHFGQLQGDSPGYIEILQLLRGTGDSQILQWHGILRPVVPLLAVPLSFLLGYGPAIAAVNLGFIVLGTVVTYLLCSRLLGREVGFISALAFASAVPVLAYGFAVLTDGAGYAMLVTVVYVILFGIPSGSDFNRRSIMIGMLVGVSILTKETCFIGLIFLWARYILDRKTMSLRNVLVITVVALVISVGYSQIVGHSYLRYYQEGLQYGGGPIGYKGPLLHPRTFLISNEYAYYILLPLAFLGFFTVGKDQFKVLVQILFSTGVLVLLWPTPPESRLSFLTFPAVIPLAAFAISQAADVLAVRPYFSLLNRRRWVFLIVIALIVLTNVLARKLILLP
jgi:hypothetical protein